MWCGTVSFGKLTMADWTVAYFSPGPTSSVLLGHPSRGSSDGYWQVLRSIDVIAVQTWRIEARAARRIVVVAIEPCYSGKN
jgi:hypothetical protein